MLTLGVIGDFGVISDNSVNISNLVKSWNPDVILTTGDNLYKKGLTVEKYEYVVGSLYGEYNFPAEQIAEISADQEGRRQGEPDLTLCTKNNSRIPCERRFLPCVGNHDYPYEPYCNYFGLDTYYAVEFTKYGNLLKVISINNDNYTEVDGQINQDGSIQRKWLQNELCNSSNFKWIIIYNHFPQLCTNNDKTENNNQLRKFPYHEYPNVVLVLSGHQHIYERLNVNGVPNVVIGTSGHSVRKIREGFKVPESLFIDNSGYGALKLTVDKTRIYGEYFVLESEVQLGRGEGVIGTGTDGRARAMIKDSFVIH